MTPIYSTVDSDSSSREVQETEAMNADVRWYGLGAVLLGIWASLFSCHVFEYWSVEFVLS